MSDRNYEPSRRVGKGLFQVNFSFATNGASDPSLATLRGAGKDHVASITYAATGKYTVVLKDKYRYCAAKTPDLEDIASPDGGYASIGPVSNEGSGTLAPSFVVATFAANGTLTQFTTRRVSVFLDMKNSTVGV